MAHMAMEWNSLADGNKHFSYSKKQLYIVQANNTLGTLQYNEQSLAHSITSQE